LKFVEIAEFIPIAGKMPAHSAGRPFGASHIVRPGLLGSMKMFVFLMYGWNRTGQSFWSLPVPTL